MALGENIESSATRVGVDGVCVLRGEVNRVQGEGKGTQLEKSPDRVT